MFKILLVDDDAIARRGIRYSIPWIKYGFEISGEAADGWEALQICINDPPDILLTDIKMPVYDGLWLCEQVSQRFPQIPMIIMSGYEDFEYARRAVHLGVKEYIVKPVEAEELIDLINRIKGNMIDSDDSITDILLPDSDEWNQLTIRAVRYVEAHYMQYIDIKTIASEIFVSENYFCRNFKKNTGVNFTDFLNRYRIECSKRLLKHPDLKITDVAEMCGYQSYKYYHQVFSRYENCSPKEYRDRQILMQG